MSVSTANPGEQLNELFEPEAARSLLDQLLTDSRLYTQSKDYRALLTSSSGFEFRPLQRHAAAGAETGPELCRIGA